MSDARSAPSVDLSMLLNQASFALGNRLTGALEDVGITVRIYCVLTKAAEAERTQSQLAELTFTDKTTMVVTLDEMERRGLAERRVSPTDRRVRVIGVTDAGREVLDRAHRLVAEVYDDVLDTVSAERRDAFLAVLDELVAGPLAAPFHLEKPVRRRKQRSAA